jgi:hypothetical protein
MSVRVRSDRHYRFDVPPQRLWERMTAVDEYRTWWPWLHGLDADRFEPGASWTCVIQPPLPYTLRFDLRLVAVEAPTLAIARLEGDIVGDAQLDVVAAGAGAQARLVSDLAPGNRMLRAVAGVARPLARFGHDWVLDTGARQFREQALPPEPEPDRVARR